MRFSRRAYPLLLLLCVAASACAPRTQSVSVSPASAPEPASSPAIGPEGSVDRTAEVRGNDGADPLPAPRADRDPEVEVGELRGADSTPETPQPGEPEDIALPDSLPPDLFLPLHRNAQVLDRLEYYTQGAGRSTMEIGLERAALYMPLILRIFREEGVPEGLLYMAQAESTFKPEAVSRSGARGIWQFISETGENYGLRSNWWIDERSDPEKSTRAAARHLRDLFDQFGDWYLAMAAYNSGPGRVASAIERGESRDFWDLSEKQLLPPETRNYVPTIIAMAVIGANPARYGFDIPPAPAIDVERVSVSQATDLRVIADHLGLPVGELESLNPHVLRWATPPDDPDFELILPAGYRPAFVSRVAPLAEEERILFRHHLVESGETLSFIARRYDIPISVIAQANGLADPDALRIGQSLMIPLSGMTLPGPLPVDPEDPIQIPPAIYRIGPGDTLSSLSERYGVGIGDIQAWNAMSSDVLIAGETLRLTAPEFSDMSDPPTSASDPGPIVYSVRAGDTLTRIARLYATSVEALLAWNLDADLSVIRPGDEIMIYTTESARR